MSSARMAREDIRVMRAQALCDHMVSASTSARMKRIRQRDTAPELEVRRALTALGVRYRLCPSDLPGRPDLANKSRRWALFVHGCFWHHHQGCRLATIPKSNREFWIEKLSGNRRRDTSKVHALEALGYRVFVVWQCEIADSTALSRLGSILRRRR